MAEKDEAGPAFFAGLLIGGFIGAAVGVLMAPRAGREMLDEVRTRGGEWAARGREQLEEQTQTIRDALEEVREILRETVEEGKEVLREAVADARQATNREVEDLKNRFESAKEGRPPEGTTPPSSS